MLKSLTVNINEKLDANHEKLRKEFDQMADQHHFEEQSCKKRDEKVKF